ncbi:hypothetical protein [Paenibacillus sp. LHD-38]|uniref:hypothetical protein n=1 Tax=Paenibacillus sp. LHD-38 TaxID=3072143 RepID=UPI00280F9C4D|nr:hypothetical protein [Paenibacillus sp. LHD-38]MDQ8738460.1 hypothetical protein [Paenibacillus sp. LHD-38]
MNETLFTTGNNGMNCFYFSKDCCVYEGQNGSEPTHVSFEGGLYYHFKGFFSRWNGKSDINGGDAGHSNGRLYHAEDGVTAMVKGGESSA